MALLPVLGLVWYFYRRARAAERPASAVWLWQEALAGSSRRTRWSLELLFLLLATLIIILALARPYFLTNQQNAWVFVIDASASMAANDLFPTRLEAAKTKLAPALERAQSAVLVRAGLTPEVFGPARGSSLQSTLVNLEAGDRSADLEAAIAAGLAALPGGQVVVASDSPAPAGVDQAFNFGGEGENVGITAIADSFVAVGNSSSRPYRGSLEAAGKTYPLQVPARGFQTLNLADSGEFEAKIPTSDALGLDDQAFYTTRSVRVGLGANEASLMRALQVVGARPAANSFQAWLGLGPPPAQVDLPSLYFATQTQGITTVFAQESAHPLLQGVELVGYQLSVPVPPQGEWQPAVTGTQGEVLVYTQPQALYLPPLPEVASLPALPIMIYNLVKDLSQASKPLGSDGILHPGIYQGFSYNLTSATETFLPHPHEAVSSPPPPEQRADLAPYLWTVAAVLLAVASLVSSRSKIGS